MEPRSYSMLLTEYGRCFADTPPLILSEEGACELVLRALQRGSPIIGSDLSAPSAPSEEAAMSPAA
jgi:hypothetical protein